MGHEKTISLISDDEETAYQTKTFSYSKFTIEQQLHKLEQRMRDEGYTLEEFTEGDFTHSHFNTNSEKKLYRRMQGKMIYVNIFHCLQSLISVAVDGFQQLFQRYMKRENDSNLI